MGEECMMGPAVSLVAGSVKGWRAEEHYTVRLLLVVAMEVLRLQNTVYEHAYILKRCSYTIMYVDTCRHVIQLFFPF